MQVTLGSPITQTVALSYNAFGQRSGYSVTPAGAGQPSLSESFKYQGDQLSQVATTGTGITTPYTDIYVYTQDGTPLELLRQTASSTTPYWYVLDGKSNVVALTNSAGSVVDSYAYDQWGKLVTSSEAVPQQLRYAGYWYDNELGWYWLSVRSYDPALERFLQPDPSEHEGLFSYVYAGDNPSDLGDPSGLIATPLQYGILQPCSAPFTPIESNVAVGSAQWIYEVNHGNCPVDGLAGARAATGASATYGTKTLYAMNKKVQRSAGSNRGFQTPPSWLISPPAGAPDAGAHEPINVVITANSNMSIADVFAAVSYHESEAWTQESTGGFSGCVVSPENGSVVPGGGGRQQSYSYREGGCDQFFSNGSHARVYAQAQPNGTTAYFIAFSEEHLCTGHAGGIPPFGIYHCISPNGFNEGRDAFVQEVQAHENQDAGIAVGGMIPIYIREPNLDYSFTSGVLSVPNAVNGRRIGTDSIGYDGKVVWITLTHK